MIKNKKSGRTNKQAKTSRAGIARSGGDRWYSKTIMGIQSFLPRRLTAVFKTDELAYYATGTAQNGGIFNICASSFFNPFAVVSNKIGVTGAGTGFSNLTLNGSYNNTQNPLGYAELLALYDYYKVRKARLRITVDPSANADNLLVVAYAAATEQSTLTIAAGASQPYSKSVLTNSAQKSVIEIDLSSPTVLGYSPIQYEGLLPTLFGASPGASQQWFYNVQWETVSGSNPSAQIFYQVELWQEVEVSGLQYFAT